MAKLKTAYFCQNCGAQYSKWQGQCYTCKQWNTIVEEVVQKDTAPAWQEKESPIKNKAPKYIPISQIDTQQEARLNSNNHELNNAFRRRTRDRQEYTTIANSSQFALSYALRIRGGK